MAHNLLQNFTNKKDTHPYKEKVSFYFQLPLHNKLAAMEIRFQLFDANHGVESQ